MTPISFARFVIPSTFAVIFFLVPISLFGESAIPVSLLSSAFKDQFLPFLPLLLTLIIVISSVLGIATHRSQSRSALVSLFKTTHYWLALRIIGAVFAVMIFSHQGPEWITGDSTGGSLLNQLIPAVFCLFLAVMFVLPLMTEFGIMEFVGTLVTPFFRKVFHLPGNAAIDALASWFGAAPIGVLITSQQYRQGKYTQKEAITIMTSFSVASVGFCLLIAEVLNLTHLFTLYYASVALASIIAAVILVRISPIRSMNNDYFNEAKVEPQIGKPAHINLFNWALIQAVERARQAPKIQVILRRSTMQLLDLWFGLIPSVLAIGTISLVLVEYTQIFTWISYPFKLLLELLAIPEAAQAAPAMVVGFADMFIPAILGKSIDSELTRFVIAGVSVTQIIYMSEIGALILKSPLKVKIHQLAVIFLLRTLITLPIFALIGHLFIG